MAKAKKEKEVTLETIMWNCRVALRNKCGKSANRDALSQRFFSSLGVTKNDIKTLIDEINKISVNNQSSKDFTTNQRKPTRTTGSYRITSSCGSWLINLRIDSNNENYFYSGEGKVQAVSAQWKLNCFILMRLSMKI